MSLIFGTDPPKAVPVSYHDDLDGKQDPVRVGKQLWDQLIEEAGLPHSTTTVLAASITPIHEHRQKANTGKQDKHADRGPKNSTLRALTCWFALDLENSGNLKVPRSWIHHYPRIFAQPPSHHSLKSQPPSPTHLITITQATLLTEIFLLALSTSAYEFASSSPSTLETWLEIGDYTNTPDDPASTRRRIIRQGDILTFTSSQPPISQNGVAGDMSHDFGNGEAHARAASGHLNTDRFKYHVVMSGPVLQGYTKKGLTRFFVTPGPYSDEDGELEGDERASLPRAHHPNGDARSNPDLDSELDSDSFEIDEGFLASSVLFDNPAFNLSLNSNEIPGLCDTEVIPNGDPNATPTEAGTGADALPQPPKTSNSKPIGRSKGTDFSGGTHSSTFEVRALDEPPPTPLGRDLGPTEAPDVPRLDEDEPCVYVRTPDLGRGGLFSDDWAVVTHHDSKDSRLARVRAGDDFIANESRGVAFTSPTLIYNISNPSTQQQSVGSSQSLISKISIRPSPFTGTQFPPIPTARAITIARVASPHASDRTYQPLFLRALKLYFKDKKRLVKKGDLVAVPIWVEQARLLKNGVGSGANEDSEGKDKSKDAAEGAKNEETFDEILDYALPGSSKTPSSAVFFQITNLEYDILDTERFGNGGGIRAGDHYIAAAAMGELGCWVDPTVTKMIQTGLEHSRVPDVSSYFGLNTGCPLFPNDSRLTASGTAYRKLYDLVEASLWPSSVDYDLDMSVLLKGSRGIGKQTIARWVAAQLGMHVFEINCFDVVGETDVKTEGTLRARFEQAAGCSPCICLLRNIDALARTSQTLETGKEPVIIPVLQECLVDLRQAWKLSGFPVIVVGTTSDPDKVPIGVLACFKNEIPFEVPSEPERLDILTNLLAGTVIAPDVSISSIATQTAALVASDLVDLVSRTHNVAMERALSGATLGDSSPVMEHDIIRSGIQLTGADFDAAISKARASYSESIGAPKIPSVSWDDVGGLANVKADILDTIQLPLEHPELFADGLKKRSGILLYGPPGTGKTLLAKAVATSCSLNFFSVKGPELLNMYIGESEANVRRVFQRARDAKPCVIFFDELDSVAPKRGNHGDSGGVMDRIVSQLLAELDGMAESGGSGGDVFVIGATNRPDLLDPALLRPGRFDRMLYLGVSDTHEAQFNILQALTRKFRLDASLDLRVIAAQCPFNYTGADFYALCSDAMLKAMARKAKDIEVAIAKINAEPPASHSLHPHPLTPQYYLAEIATDAETDVQVSQRDFELALKELVPSVSASEMEHYRTVQQRFAKETINADKEEISEDDQDDQRSLEQARRAKGKGRASVDE